MKRIMILNTSYNYLNEDKNTDIIKRYIENNSVYTKDRLKTLVSELDNQTQNTLKSVSPDIFKACINHNQNLLAFYRLYFISYFDLSHGKGPQEYIPGITRIAIQELQMFKGNRNDSELSHLKILVLFLHNADENIKSKYNSDLNGLDYYALDKELNQLRKEFNHKNREVLQSISITNKNYKVVTINSFNDATKYGKYVKWCITYSKSNYDGYTENGRRFYFCFTPGFENIKKCRV